MSAPPTGTHGDPLQVGTLVSLMGGKGGCGVTLLAANLGAQLAFLNRVCLVDLCGSQGDVAAYLDLEQGHDLSELLGAREIDAPLLDGFAARHRSGLAVLHQGTDLAEVAILEVEAVDRLLEACQRAYDIVLVDCGTALDEATLTAHLRADAVGLVTTPDVPAVRDTLRRLRLLDRLRVERERVRLIVNQVGRHPQLGVDAIEEQLGRRVAAVVREDAPACARSHLEGGLVWELPGHHPIKDDFARLWPALVGGSRLRPSAGRRLGRWLHPFKTAEAT